MSQAIDSQPGLPPGRYGNPPKLPRWVAIGLVALGVLALVPVALAAADRANPDARATVTGFDVINDHEVKAMVDLTKPTSRAASCTVQARNFYSDVVGSAQIALRVGEPSAVVSRTFPTSDKAVVVEVTGCVLSPGS